MWGLFACNDLLHRRFGKLSSGDCAACGAGHTEDPVHVIGTCGDLAAVDIRAKFVAKMWSALASAMRQPKQALDADLAQAIRRLWSMHDGERLRQWSPGMLGRGRRRSPRGCQGSAQRLSARFIATKNPDGYR